MNMSAALLYSARLAICGSALILSRVPRRKISPPPAPETREGAFGLHPDFVGGAGGEIVAQPGAEEGGGLGDDELALGAEALRWRRRSPAASAVESAPLPSRITTPLTRLSRPAASSPSTTSITVTRRGREDAAGRGGAVVDRLAQIQRQHHVAGQPVAARQRRSPAAPRQTSTSSDHGLGDAVEHRHQDGAEPGQKTDHENSFGGDPHISPRRGQSHEKARPPTGTGPFA